MIRVVCSLGRLASKLYFASVVVNKKKSTYNFFNRLSAALMFVTLIWLTISIPFVAAVKEEIAKKNKTSIQISYTGEREEGSSTTNPLNGTEEKAPGSINLAEEFLHDHSTTEHFIAIVSEHYNPHMPSTYEAFHGELLVPPPNRA